MSDQPKPERDKYEEAIQWLQDEIDEDENSWRVDRIMQLAIDALREKQQREEDQCPG